MRTFQLSSLWRVGIRKGDTKGGTFLSESRVGNSNFMPCNLVGPLLTIPCNIQFSQVERLRAFSA